MSEVKSKKSTLFDVLTLAYGKCAPSISQFYFISDVRSTEIFLRNCNVNNMDVLAPINGFAH